MHIFTEGTYFLPWSIFQNVPLALETYNRPFIDSLGFMIVDEMKKDLLGQGYSPWPSFLNEGQVEYL